MSYDDFIHVSSWKIVTAWKLWVVLFEAKAFNCVDYKNQENS